MFSASHNALQREHSHVITDSDHLNRDAPESPPVEVKGSNGAGAPSSTSQVRLRPRENAAPFVLSFQRSGGGVGGGAAAGRAHLFWLNKRLVAAWCATSERVLQFFCLAQQPLSFPPR